MPPVQYPDPFFAPLNNALALGREAALVGYQRRQGDERQNMMRRGLDLEGERNAMARERQLFEIGSARDELSKRDRATMATFAQRLLDLKARQPSYFAPTYEAARQNFPEAKRWLPALEVGGEAALRALSMLAEGQTPPSTPATDIDDYVSDFVKQWELDHNGEKPPPGKLNEARMQFKRAQAGEAAGIRGATLDVDLAKRPKLEAAVTRAKTEAELDVRRTKEPSVVAAVEAAKEKAKADATAAQKTKDNQSAWAVYDASMRNLTDALAGTTTGPFMDWVPTVTSNAQVAEGAIAAMAPVLKQLFRASGEGIFTDKDQELLLRMIPTRDTLPAARAAQFRAIDMIVRAKLGIQQSGGDLPPGVTEEDIQTTMQKHGMTRQQVLDKLGAK